MIKLGQIYKNKMKAVFKIHSINFENDFVELLILDNPYKKYIDEIVPYKISALKDLELLKNYIYLDKWDKRFYQLAETVATWSKDKTKVGCVLISPDKTQISYGYNGFPRGIKDNQRLTSENKNNLIVHAELNAILNSTINLKDWTLYATKFPCIDCAKAIIQSHFKRIVVKSRTGGSWGKSQQLAYNIIKEAKIIISEV